MMILWGWANCAGVKGELIRSVGDLARSKSFAAGSPTQKIMTA
jgi:hypothetical protein